MINISEKDLYQLLISEARYAIKRDNHLAPGTCVQHVMDYLPEFSKQWQSHIAAQLTDEIITERVWGGRHSGRLEYDSDWEKLLVFLTDYLETLPINVEKYMAHLYNKPGYIANINYYSAEIAEKIRANLSKIN